MLTGYEIRDHVASGQIEIQDFDLKRLNPNSYNLRLHDQLMCYKDELIDLRTAKQSAMQTIQIPEEGLVLQPNKLYLGRTMEYTRTHNHIPKIEGRSSIARAGLFIHITAGFGDIGYEGYWTLELHCVQPIRIYPNIEICQISYFTPIGHIGDNKYKGKYQKNTDIQQSLIEL